MAFENFREYKYHFTSCAGLYGMLQGYSKNNPNLTMWATHSSFMNDPTEYEHGKEMCLRVFESYEKKLGTYKTDISIFKMGRKQISDFMTKEAPFLISLSGNIESAAMWSMYSSNGSGIALKFDVATLQKYALLKDNDSIEPTGCIYCKSASDILKKHGKYIEVLYGALRESLGNNNDTIHDMLLFDIASQIKHSSYQYEDEHRIIVNKGNHKVLFRERGGVIIPYIEVKIPIDALKGIIVGPTANFEYVKKSIEMFIDSLDWDPLMQPLSINIKKSEVPYRG